MNKIIILALLLNLSSISAQNTVDDTISTGFQYVNQVWYSLANGEISSQPKDDWDLGIELTGFNSSILVNTQKTGTALYLSPYVWNQWAAFDTTGYRLWTPLHNSDTLWDIGALNRPGTYNTSDLGWGTYDMSTHAIIGTRLYLLTLPGNKFLKIGVKNLIGGKYTITYANSDNSDSSTFTINKTDYTGKNFVYYNIGNKTILDREPNNKDWDFTFTKYIFNRYPVGNGSFIPYGVTGLLQNKGVKVAEVGNVDVDNTNDYTGYSFSSRINEVGSDWKKYTGTYVITDSLVYFVQDVNKDYWKLVMTGFSGGNEGNYMFSKKKLSTVGIIDQNSGPGFCVFPNPVNYGSTLNILANIKNQEVMTISILDLNGKIHYQNTRTSNSGYNLIEVPAALANGFYCLSVLIGSSTYNTNFIVN